MTDTIALVAPLADEIRVPNLIRRDANVIYFKKKAPADIARLYGGKPEFWLSLDTTNMEEAITKRPAANDEYVEWCNKLLVRIGEPPRITAISNATQDTKYLTKHIIPQLLWRYKFHMLEDADDARRSMSKKERKAERLFYQSCLNKFRKSAAAKRTDFVEETARQILAGEHLIAPPKANVWNEFLERLMQTEMHVLEETIAKFMGRSCATNGEAPLAARCMATVTDAYKEWRGQYRADIGASTNGDGANKKTEDAYEHYADRFISICGDFPLKAIEPEDVQRFVDGLVLEGLLLGTVKNHVSALAVMLRAALPIEFDSHGKAKHKCVFDFADFRMVPKTPEDQLRRGFEEFELEMLLGSPMYATGRNWSPELVVDPAHYWLVPFSMYVAPRIEEYAQLLVQNVLKRDGVWGVLLSDVSSHLKRKSTASTRFVPLHRELVDWGFLRYVEHVRKQGNTRLFPTLKNNNRYQRYGEALSKWFAGYCDSVGLTTSVICHHSFRYTLSQRLLARGAPEVAVDAILGHWITKVSQHSTRPYLKQNGILPQDIVVRAIEFLDYFDARGISMPSHRSEKPKAQLTFSMKLPTFSVPASTAMLYGA
jgi:integrase